MGQNFKSIIFLLSLSALFIIQCSEPYTPHEKSVAHILKTLSSDEMRGREAFTSDIELAADFISTQFKRSGLKTLNESEGYRQTFTLQETNIANSSVSVNNRILSSENYFALLNGSSIEWSPNIIKISEIKENENYRARFGELSDSSEDLLVFVDPSHSDIFGMYQNYFSRPSRTLERNDRANIVFILSNKSMSFSINIEADVTEKELSNVVGIIPGNRPDEYVLFSAHHDHIGIRTPIEGDSIANGANDNGSGVTAVIELAKYFSSLPKPERSLVFATFTAEEMGGYGSQYFSKQLDPDEIIAMFNIEMIGKPAVSGPNTAWITGYDRSDFGELLSKSAEGTIYEFYPDPYPQQNLFYRSDNATLARLGVPAHSISTTPIDVDKDYHQVSDEFETIDISHLTNTINAIAKAAEGIVSGKDTPTRVDTSLVD